MFSIDDHRYMARALELARRGLYSTDPNPRVGAVLVRDGRVVGEGFHQRAGEPHAEVHALAAAGDAAEGATAYVTLEPCAHQGRTPPCTQALLSAGIRRLVTAMTDPNPQVAGRGHEALQARGVEVSTGLMAAEARALNIGFVQRMARNRPWVRLKLAQSLDGRTAMASGESQWITGPAARQDVQRLRARSSAILTGSGTLVGDDPALTVRPQEPGPEHAEAGAPRQPLRLVLDRRLRTPVDARMLKQPGRTLILHQSDDSPRLEALQEAGAQCQRLPEGLESLLGWLARDHQCNELLVEAGPTLAGAFMAADLVDELVIYQAPLLLGSQARPLLEWPLTRMDQGRRLRIRDQRRLGPDLRLVLTPENREETPCSLVW